MNAVWISKFSVFKSVLQIHVVINLVSFLVRLLYATSTWYIIMCNG